MDTISYHFAEEVRELSRNSPFPANEIAEALELSDVLPTPENIAIIKHVLTVSAYVSLNNLDTEFFVILMKSIMAFQET